MEKPLASIRIDRPFPMPEGVRDTIATLTKAGFVAYLVGGGVRDFLSGREPKDHDIATNARPEDMQTLFPTADFVGKAFGVVKISPDLEVATFRTDLNYKDFRHPSQVEFRGPAEDAARRDFTVNALFFDPKTQTILDYVGGLDDLKSRTLKAIGNAADRFREDALRLMRAVRFATTLEFEIEDATSKGIKKHAGLIAKISTERVGDELNRMLKGPAPARAITLLSEHGLLTHILPEVEHLRKIKDAPLAGEQRSVWDNTLALMETLTRLYPARSTALAWAALLHDVGKAAVPGKGEHGHFNGHEREGVKIVQRVCKRLKLSNSDIDGIALMVQDQLKFREVFQMREATLVRWLRRPSFEDELRLHRADAISGDGNLAHFEFCESRLRDFRAAPPIPRMVDGADLIQLGLSPGPDFARILDAIEDLQIEGRLRSKDEALEYVLKHFVR